MSLIVGCNIGTEDDYAIIIIQSSPYLTLNPSVVPNKEENTRIRRVLR